MTQAGTNLGQMRARELARPFPTVTLATDALVAAATMARRNLPGLVVLDDKGRPFAVVPAAQVLQFVIPGYVQDDPHLARVYDEDAADSFCRKLATVSIGDVLEVQRGDDHQPPPIVDGDATMIEVAAVMARSRSPLAVVVDGDDIIGVIGIGELLGRLLPNDADAVPEPLGDHPSSTASDDPR